jgi:tRNA A37 threonylcarbamoyladenosine synthetase subunit TsaC/SUA5/YrdC
MARELDYIFDGGVLPIRPASTVIDLSGELPQILRHGGVSQEAIESALGVEFQHGMV